MPTPPNGALYSRQNPISRVLSGFPRTDSYISRLSCRVNWCICSFLLYNTKTVHRQKLDQMSLHAAAARFPISVTDSKCTRQTLVTRLTDYDINVISKSTNLRYTMECVFKDTIKCFIKAESLRLTIYKLVAAV